MSEHNTLISIPISHYCDKVRWGLELANISYCEKFHIQVFSWLPALKATRLKSRYVPVLITPAGVLHDSTVIFKYIDSQLPKTQKIYPLDLQERSAVEDLEDYFDEVLGPASRMWCYCQLFRHKNIALRYNSFAVSPYQKALMPSLFSTLVAIGKKILTINDETYLTSIETIESVLTRVETLLSDGREFLTGNRLSAADITFASMMAPLIMPPNYGVPIPSINEFDKEAKEVMLAYLERPSGQFAFKLYQEQRQPRDYSLLCKY